MKGVSLQPSESIVFTLRSLYDSFGYSRYKMNKFEEYDLYARNKDFLISDGVITFTDTNGKLMALKPDVTLSIVKNTKDVCGEVQKLYYNENVYRVSKGTHSFKEIMQVGLEAIGDIDDYCIYEVIKLACDSLVSTQKNCILEVSHLGIISDVISYIGIPSDEKEKILHFLGEKNVHELKNTCEKLGIDEEKSSLLTQLAAVYGSPDEVLARVNDLLCGIVDEKTLSGFTKIVSALNASDRKDIIRIDFSIVSDMRYYNGFVFKGYAQGVSSSILSGGQYDTLMKKMNRKSGAVGFAVYLDILEQLSTSSKYDVDTLVIYDALSDISQIEKAVKTVADGGESVMLQRKIPSGIKYRRLVKIINGEVKTVENDA